MAKEKRIGIILVGLFIILTPLWVGIVFNAMSVTLGYNPQPLMEIIRRAWLGFIFYGILGIGVLILNNAARILTVVILIAEAAGGFLGLIIGYITVGPKIHSEIIKKYGASVIINIWLAVIIVCLLLAAIAFYLTRPKVKELFLKQKEQSR